MSKFTDGDDEFPGTAKDDTTFGGPEATRRTRADTAMRHETPTGETTVHGDGGDDRPSRTVTASPPRSTRSLEAPGRPVEHAALEPTTPARTRA